MDIVLIFLAISLLGWFFSMAFKKNRKNAKKEFKEAVVGGLGVGVVYLMTVCYESTEKANFSIY